MSESDFIRAVISASRTGQNYPFAWISGRNLLKLARTHGLDPLSAQQLTLRNGISLERYLRNYSSMTLKMQLALACSRILIVGAGGLGGYVLELLVRTGVGTCLVADGDVFEESNLNRQILGSMDHLGTSKQKAALERVRRINPFTRLELCSGFLESSDLPDTLMRVDLVLDCLGGTDFRKNLLLAAQKHGRALITGFVAGKTGLACTVYPGDKDPAAFWPDGREQSAEDLLGNLATIVCMIAAIQAQEAINVLSGQKPQLRNKVFLADLDTFAFQMLKL